MSRFGDEGAVVRALQVELQELGYYVGPLDGRYGDLTAQAVRGIQEEFQLQGDAIVGPVTRQMLDSLEGHRRKARRPRL